MAIGDDFSVDFSTGDIRHVSGTTNYTVLAMHRWLQDLADNPETTGGNDILDITSPTPSERSTDQIITLINGFNIDDTTAQFLYGGSIKQGSGATETLYSGLQVLGSVASTSTQIQVVQDKTLPYTDSPFWGNQSVTFNSGGNVLRRMLIKSREYGADIDQQQIIVQIRNYGDTYSFFNVTLGEGESVAAVSSVDDPQNDTASGTVTAYTHVTNTEGYQTIDIGDGNGAEPYYSKWTYGADTAGDQLKSVWEWGKDLTKTGTAKTIHGIDGEMFQGVSHQLAFDNQSGTFQEDEEVVWGTQITYDGLAGGTFSAGDYVRIGSSGAAGRVMYDNGTTIMIVALEDPGITILDNDVITEASAGTVTADATAAILNNSAEGGSGLVLAFDDTSDKLWIQKRTGTAPVDNLPLRGLTSGATADMLGASTPRTVNPVFLGNFVGTMIGGYGVGFDSGDLTASDTVTNLNAITRTPPNNVTFTLSGLEAGEDYVLIGPKAGGNDFLFSQTSLTTTLNGAAETDLVVDSMPANTPASGTLRVTLDDGRVRRVPYSSYTGTTFTMSADPDWQDPDDATSGANVMVSYIDKLAAATSEAFNTIYTSGPLTLWIRVRDGGTAGDGEGMKTFEVQASLGPNGGSATSIRISDV